MTTRPASQLADSLREVIRNVEESAGVSPDDLALVELKRILLRKIAALEEEQVRSEWEVAI
jgi:hypothetical protein